MTLKTYQVSLDKDAVKRLDFVAIEEERSRSFLLRKAIERYLKEVENADRV